MRHLRSTRVVGLALTLVLGFSYACAVSDNEPSLSAESESNPGDLPDAAAEDTAILFPDAPPPSRLCTDSGFCYVPIPGVGPLRAVSASSMDDAWMLSEVGARILRWDGTGVTTQYAYTGTTPSTVTFLSIWAERKDDVWAVAYDNGQRMFVVRYAPPVSGGEPEFREFSTTYRLVRSILTPPEASVWGTPDGDALWVASTAGVVRLREDESGLIVEPLSLPPPGAGFSYFWYGVWGFGPDDVYIAGKRCGECSIAGIGKGAAIALLAHYDGASWSITEIPSTWELSSLRGTRPGAPRQLWYTTTVETFAPDEPLIRDPLNDHACRTRSGRRRDRSGGIYSFDERVSAV